MEQKVQALASEIIAKIQRCKEGMDHEQLAEWAAEFGNPMHTGWCARWYAGLYSKDGTIDVSANWCPYIKIHRDKLEDLPLESDIQGIFEAPEHRACLVASLRQWLEDEVQGQEYGGFYTEEVVLSIFSDTADFEDRTSLTVRDEGRWQQLLENLREFVKNEDYKTISIDRIHLDIKRMVFVLMRYLTPELGLAKVMEIVDTLVERCRPYYSQMEDLHRGARKALFERDKSVENTPEQLDLCCYICLLMIRHGDDYSHILKDLAKTYKHQWAKDIIKFGSGEFDREDTELVHEQVICSVNDISRVVTVKFKQETDESYSAVLGFLARLMEIGFPVGYTIKANQKQKDLLPAKGLKKSTTNKFWNACRAFPGCFHAMAEYFQKAVDPYKYYGDAEEEEAVSAGGYAAFVLGLESEAYFDVLRQYMQQVDSEHCLTADLFANAFIRKWGVTETSALAVADCLLGANGHELDYGLDLSGFHQPGPLAQLAQYMGELKSHQQERLIGLIWGSREDMEAAVDQAPDALKPDYQTILKLWI